MQIMAEIRGSKKKSKKVKIFVDNHILEWYYITCVEQSTTQNNKKRHAGVLELADRLD